MTEGNTDPSEIQQRLTVKDAADALGISSDAVRTRIQRGTLRSIHERGRVWVVLDPDETRSNTDRSIDQIELVHELRARVAFLEGQLKIRTEENRRKDHLLAAALERIPALEPPQRPENRPRRTPPAVPIPRDPQKHRRPQRRPHERRARGGVGCSGGRRNDHCGSRHSRHNLGCRCREPP